MRGHPQEAQLLSGLKGGASAFEFLTEEYRGTAVDSPYRQDASTPSSYGGKLQLYFNMDVRLKEADVRAPTGPARSKLVLPVCVEPEKSRLVIDTRARNEYCRLVPLRMDTVAWVADIAGEGIYTGSMHDRSGFHNLCL